MFLGSLQPPPCRVKPEVSCLFQSKAALAESGSNLLSCSLEGVQTPRRVTDVQHDTVDRDEFTQNQVVADGDVVGVGYCFVSLQAARSDHTTLVRCRIWCSCWRRSRR